MASIDISSGISFIESFMVDTCAITRDVQGVLDDVLDLSTGLLVRPNPDTISVYTGKCLFRTKVPRQRPPETFPGQGEHEFKFFELLLPVSVVDIEIGDKVTPLTSVNDARLLTRSLLVADISDWSLRTYRTCSLTDVSYMVKPED